MFLLMRQNMELTTFIVSYMKGMVVHLHTRIGQPPSHSNDSAAGANKSVIQHHVPAIAAEHGTKSIS
jgi:hypothetical protein